MFLFNRFECVKSLAVPIQFEHTCASRTIAPWKCGWIEIEKSHSARAACNRDSSQFISLRCTNSPCPTKWKIIIEKWTRLCTSCHIIIHYIHTKRIGSKIGFHLFFKFVKNNIFSCCCCSLQLVEIHLSGYFMANTSKWRHGKLRWP